MTDWRLRLNNKYQKQFDLAALKERRALVSSLVIAASEWFYPPIREAGEEAFEVGITGAAGFAFVTALISFSSPLPLLPRPARS